MKGYSLFILIYIQLRCSYAFRLAPRRGSPYLNSADPKGSRFVTPSVPFDVSAALESSTSAAKSSIVQLTLLMWTRTVLNYQYRNGVDFRTALNTLWKEGGVARLYSGLPFALVQVPSSRFCDVLDSQDR